MKGSSLLEAIVPTGGPCPAGWCLRREAGPPERSPIAGAGGPAVREQAVTVFFG